MIGPSYFQCLNAYGGVFTDPATGHPVPYVKRCGRWFQTPATTSSTYPPRCFCLVFFATNRCADCGRAACNEHHVYDNDRCLCSHCVHRMDARTASEYIPPFHRAIEAMASTADLVERQIRWTCLSHIDEYLKSGLGLDLLFPALFPDDARLGRTYPQVRTGQVASWFVNLALVAGIRPVPCYRYQRERVGLFGGLSMVDMPPLEAWRFPDAGLSIGRDKPSDIYILPDGQVLYPADQDRMPPADLNPTNVLSQIAQLLHLPDLPLISDNEWSRLVPPPPLNPWI